PVHRSQFEADVRRNAQLVIDAHAPAPEAKMNSALVLRADAQRVAVELRPQISVELLLRIRTDAARVNDSDHADLAGRVAVDRNRPVDLVDIQPSDAGGRPLLLEAGVARFHRHARRREKGRSDERIESFIVSVHTGPGRSYDIRLWEFQRRDPDHIVAPGRLPG